MYREQVPSKARHDERAEVDGGFATVAIFDSAMHSACANSFKHVVASRKDLVGLVEGLVIHHAVLQARYEERVQEVLGRPTVYHHGDGRPVERVIRALQGRRRHHEGHRKHRRGRKGCVGPDPVQFERGQAGWTTDRPLQAP